MKSLLLVVLSIVASPSLSLGDAVPSPSTPVLRDTTLTPSLTPESPVFTVSTDSLESRHGLPNIEDILAGMASQTSPFRFPMPSFASALPSLFSAPPSPLMALASRRPIMVQIPPQVLEEFNANGIMMPLHKCKYCNDGRNREFHSPPFNNNNNKRYRSPGRFFQRGNRNAFNENQAALRAQQRLPTKGGNGYVQQQQIQQQQQITSNYGGKGNNDYQGGFRPMNFQGKGGRMGAIDSKKIVVVVLHLNKNDKVIAGGANPNGGYSGLQGGLKGGQQPNPYARMDQQAVKYASPASIADQSVYFDTSLFTPDNFFTMRDLAHSALFGGAPGVTNNVNDNSNIINTNDNRNRQEMPTTTTIKPLLVASSVNTHNSMSSFNPDTEVISQEKEDEASYRAATASLPNNLPNAQQPSPSSSGHHHLPFTS